MVRMANPKVELVCAAAGCGALVRRWPSQVPPSGRAYCSHACHMRAVPPVYRRPVPPVLAVCPVSGGRAVPAISLPRLAARAAALEAAAWHPTPRPAAGRAPTTAG